MDLINICNDYVIKFILNVQRDICNVYSSVMMIFILDLFYNYV